MAELHHASPLGHGVDLPMLPPALPRKLGGNAHRRAPCCCLDGYFDLAPIVRDVHDHLAAASSARCFSSHFPSVRLPSARGRSPARHLLSSTQPGRSCMGQKLQALGACAGFRRGCELCAFLPADRACPDEQRIKVPQVSEILQHQDSLEVTLPESEDRKDQGAWPAFDLLRSRLHVDAATPQHCGVNRCRLSHALPRGRHRGMQSGPPYAGGPPDCVVINCHI